MGDHAPRRGTRRRHRDTSPGLESLEPRELLAVSVLRHSIGPIVVPASISPRVNLPAPSVNAHTALNVYLSSILGPAMEDVQARAQANDAASRSALAERVLTSSLFSTILSDRDTYTLLNSSAMGALIGFSQVSTSQQTGNTVAYIITSADILSISTDTAVVQIPASGGVNGFVATVPVTSLRVLANGDYQVQIPLDQVPTDAPPPQVITNVTGSLADVFTSTGTNLDTALISGAPQRAPNAPRTVPGLRLISLLGNSSLFPAASRSALLRMMRVAVQRKLFDLNGLTQQRISQGLNQLVQAVNQLGTAAFRPAVPPPGVSLPTGALAGTLQVSAGVFQDLFDASPDFSGLQLPNIGNFPGRLDVGFVFDLAGNYGLALTVRGPLASAPGALSTPNVVGGDVKVEFSNAPNIAALNGLRSVEGVEVGSGLGGGVEASNTASGATTFAGSVGYGSGFEFGTGVAYTQVVRLGNINSLIPQRPRR
jgi:hypothetical protein